LEVKEKKQLAEEPKLICKDHLVSGEKFEIREYQSGILRTDPVPGDLEKYYESPDYISHNDSRKNFQDQIYQLVKSYMLSQKAKWIRKHIKQGKILDFGAGTGEFLNKMKSYLWNVEGVEPNRMARDLAILKGLNLKKDLAAVENKNFDVISLWHVLEHLPDFEVKISQFRKLLDDQGILVIAVPNYRSYDAEYYEENWAAWDVPRHLWHFSREGIKSKFSELGFELIDEKPLKFDSFYVSLLSEKIQGNGKGLFSALRKGYISNHKAATSGEYSSLTYFFKKSPKIDF
jgi:SAM-dependent methyltransferase